MRRVLGLILALAPTAQADDDLREGLVLELRSLAGGERIVSIEPRPSLHFLDARGGSAPGSPHPRIPPGPFEAVWSGLIEVREDEGALAFSAYFGGELEIAIGGAKVLEARSADPRERVRGPGGLRLEEGLHPFRAVYRSLPDAPARLQVFWRGERFADEPLSPFRLKHRAASEPPELTVERFRERGRTLAESLGCARCHATAFPSSLRLLPGPSLAGASRLGRAWIAGWLADPRRMRAHARMPVLFAPDRAGRIERELVARRLAPGPAAEPAGGRTGDHRMGKRRFHSLGCAACHFLPELAPERQLDLGRIPLEALDGRLAAPHLVPFLRDPGTRFPDGRMPDLRLDDAEARDLAAYILLWAKEGAPLEEAAPGEEDIDAFVAASGAESREGAADAIIRRKGCARCHEGLDDAPPEDIPIRPGRQGCLGGDTLPRFALDGPERSALALHIEAAARERHPSPAFEARRRLEAARCGQCHAHCGLGQSPLEEVGATLGGSNLERIPYLRAPRLLDPHEKYDRAHLLAAIREGPGNVRGAAYTYRMPSFGDRAEALANALASRDGADPLLDAAPAAPADPTLLGPGGTLAGFEGYSCISCHLWKGKFFHEPDPGSIGPELSTATRRLRRAWFDRWLGDPARFQPGTPMPQLLPHGERATLRNVLGGDSRLQGQAIWEFLALGAAAPDPAPLPPIPVEPPADGSAMVALVPVRLPGGDIVESITVVTSARDILVVDVESGAPRGLFTGARLLRREVGRLRFYEVDGTALPIAWEPCGGDLEAHYRLVDGVRFRWRAPGGALEPETLRFAGRTLVRELAVSAQGIELGPAKDPPPAPRRAVIPGEPREGSLERPGYRAVAYPRPKLPNGEDALMPGGVAVDPASGRVFIASMKLGRIFALEDPTGDGREARYIDWTRGLFQDALSLHAEPGELWVLHRRNLTRCSDADGDGLADRFERMLALPHGKADDYDFGYGLIREPGGAFVFGYAPYAHRKLEGSGGGVRVRPGREYRPEEIASGFRNPVGWCLGPEGDVFCTDNQGEWVATNKLCHADGKRWHGFPNPERRPPEGTRVSPPAVWVPYDWARSLNGITFDATGGKFGPFAGQIFIAELMFGGAIIRASLEKVGGEWQGACFPFWGKGLLGPLTLAFGPDGRLWVGSITEPGWMAQPDRGGLFRIDFTGHVPFEIETIRALPGGFRLVFTRKVDAQTLTPESFEVESWRYEHTAAYGSPEYDRARVAVAGCRPSPDGLRVDLEVNDMRPARVYKVSAPGVRSTESEPLVHPAGVYTLNAVPGG